jgi:putative membrane protein
MVTSAFIAQSPEWTASPANPSPWLETVGLIAPWVLAAAVVAMVVYGLATRARYRAVGVLKHNDLEQVRAELAKVEQGTTGEIVPVVLERSDPHPSADWLAALAMVLVGSALLAGILPWDRPLFVLLTQIALGAVGFALARALPGVKRLLVSDAQAAAAAEEQAFQEFYRNGLHKTQDATGVLIFVSLFEHRAIVLGDEGISRYVHADHWSSVDNAILAGIRDGSLRAGLIAGIHAAGKELQRLFPSIKDNQNELSDRLIVRRE